jgi:hypothetical protein
MKIDFGELKFGYADLKILSNKNSVKTFFNTNYTGRHKICTKKHFLT